MSLETFERLCSETVRFDCTSLGLQTDQTVKPAWAHEAYQVTIARGDESYSTTYRQGTGHTHAPTISQVLSCLLSDARAANEHSTFESFCSEFGYDEDSWTAERVYRACQECSAALRRILGEDYDRLDAAAIEAGV
jgi:hypothetical protein